MKMFWSSVDGLSFSFKRFWRQRRSARIIFLKAEDSLRERKNRVRVFFGCVEALFQGNGRARGEFC